MKQLHNLDISNTDLARGTEYLPASVMEIWCSYYLKLESKVKLLVKELEQNRDFILVDYSRKLYLKKKLNSEMLIQLNFLNGLSLFNFNYSVRTQYEKLLEELTPSRE